MQIIKATPADLPRVMEIYQHARAFMNANGNGGQWANGYPQQSLISAGIAQGNCYVCVDDGAIIATFYYAKEQDPTYQRIENGHWLNEKPYGVLHRIAVHSSKKGIASYCLQWCFAQCGNMRIDTHQHNLPMLRVLEKNGYCHCGIIYVADGTPRLAFQKTR
ncbi:N-acetyltransferase family protein [Shewanella sp. YIC-542]|uniref:GNAT family N-acetyltransferase n=1 Tax=Shewanella mytili TaxID=3377111 RepID=UPI00398F38F0